ncbi:uncharacterized protein LOC115748399 [Rhodamnia argentea]|uniref:Uncharacterized protein LOC115748399 n=1 Tax=Rhodamnia argentea TaxID=178133 RepID=A0A8B8Q2Z6_9MYRT|nr:uncharacterized protein LOC115748399 [Rhodamnia argentea]
MEAGSSGFSAMATPVFTGENYQAWAVKMTAFLEGHDLLEAVENDYEIAPLPNNPTLNQIKFHKEKTTRKAKAKSCLYAVVSPPIFTRIMRCDSTKAIWDCLKDEYKGDEKIRSMKVLNLLREFERQEMKDSESVKEYSDRLIEIAEKIRVLGTDLKDERLVQKILVPLPKKFEATIASLENTRDLGDIKLAELLSALQAQEQRRPMRREEPVEGALQAKVKFNDGGKGKKWNQSKGNAGDSKFAAKEGSSSESGKWKKNKKPCQHCGGTTHQSFRCWRRPNAKCRRCHKMGHIEAMHKENNHQQAGEA